MTDIAATAPRRIPIDKLGVLIAAIAGVAAFLPFAAFRANRIVLGESKGLFAALPAGKPRSLRSPSPPASSLRC